MEGSERFLFLSVVLCCSGYAAATGSYPDQGFFLVARMPEIGRNTPLYIYAIHTSGSDNPGEVEFRKDGELPETGVQTGLLPEQFGCYLLVDYSDRYSGTRYGQYTATFTPESGSAELSAYTFVKPQSKVLNTRGVYTITIYPETAGSPELAEQVSIGVGWTPGCRKIVWCKGKRRNVNRGPRLTLKSTEDAGLYTISRPQRGKRGWIVQILVIGASCPEGQYLNAPGSCMSFGPCLNGGVLRDKAADCICPPSFVGDTCQCAAQYTVEDLFLAVSIPETLTCDELPGGVKSCKGFLVCYGDNYGCKCSPGWYGNACESACRKGRYGANCEQRCPDSQSDCDRFLGPTTNLQSMGCSP